MENKVTKTIKLLEVNNDMVHNYYYKEVLIIWWRTWKSKAYHI